MRFDSRTSQKARVFGEVLQRERLVLALLLLLSCWNAPVRAQSASENTTATPSTEQKLDRLTAAIAQAQAQMDSYQKQLLELQGELIALKRQMTAEGSSATQSATADEIRERLAIAESQIATHDLTKVETQSKYPLTVSGLILFNGFVNTRQVDISASPAYALTGSGSTGLSLRQTVLGLDARGPHLLGASSRADLRVDFFANGAQSNYSAAGLLRLRTAHAELNWRNTNAFIELDRSILEPNAPSSLVAIAQPELAWAGNLWNWSPQIGVAHEFALSNLSRIKAQVALIDTSDPSLPGTSSTSPVTQTERSRWPGMESRIAFQHSESGVGPEVGVGGYFSPHRNGYGDRFDAWAGTIDLRLPLTRRFEMTANAYRGQALAGLGAGGYVNYYYELAGLTETAHPLDDVGGWAQLKARAGPRLEVNAGFGTDNPFAKEVHAALSSLGNSSYYPGLARNRSVYSNVIYSPNTYLLFSLEYKRLWTSYAGDSTYFSDSIGLGAGYKF
jgi:hypothetical protein